MLQAIQNASDLLPALAHLSPVTMVGVGISAVATLVYVMTRMPELMLVVITSLMYAAVPLLPRLI